MFKLVRAGLVGLMMTVDIAATVIYASSKLSTPAPTGADSAAISEFAVSGVEYQQAAHPSQRKAVEFNIDRAPSTVLVKLVSSDPAFIACQNTSSIQWYSLFPTTIPLFSLDEVRVLVLAEQRPDHRQGE
jgi:hypothetical protein